MSGDMGLLSAICRRPGRPQCAVTTEAWGRCTIPGAAYMHVRGTETEALIVALCPTHAAIFGATTAAAA